MAERAFFPGLAEVEVQQLYRAMDFLLEAHDEIQREVFWSVRNLFNLDVDVLFIDTTSTYFEIEGEDPEENDDAEDAGDDGEAELAPGEPADAAAAERAQRGLRKHSKNSKDSRPNLAAVGFGSAVTTETARWRPGESLPSPRWRCRRARVSA